MLCSSYDRTPPCSIAPVTQCSQFFHEVQIDHLKSDTTYYYKIPAANGTTASDVLTFTTARAAGDTQEFTAVILNDMGYANAAGTHKHLIQVRFDTRIVSPLYTSAIVFVEQLYHKSIVMLYLISDLYIY